MCIFHIHQMAKCVGAQLSMSKHKEMTHNYLKYLTSPVLCENALKVRPLHESPIISRLEFERDND